MFYINCDKLFFFKSKNDNKSNLRATLIILKNIDEMIMFIDVVPSIKFRKMNNLNHEFEKNLMLFKKVKNRIKTAELKSENRFIEEEFMSSIKIEKERAKNI